MKSNLIIGRLFGIDIGINYSWFFLFGMITLSFWAQYSNEHPGWPSYAPIIAALATSAMFFLSLLAHEMSHSLLALAKGLPVHSITLFIFGGVSLIEKEAMNAATEFEVGVIGPISSFIISGIFFGLTLITDAGSPLGAAFGWLAKINLFLAIFNMIPGYPLDGGRVLRAIVWAITGSVHRATRIAAAGGQVVAWLLIGMGISMLFGATYGEYLGGGQIGGLWYIVIGGFLLYAARSSQQTIRLEEVISHSHARDVMTRNADLVPAAISLSQFFDDHLIRTGRRCYVVADDGRLLGLMTPAELKAVSRQNWPSTTVAQAMTPFTAMRWVDPDADLRQVVELLEKDEVNQVPVVSGGQLEGLIGRDELLGFIQTRSEFEHSS
jgi:Zn-dependent protease/CBS domain-containing protein